MRKLLLICLFPISGFSQSIFPSLGIPASARGLGMGDLGLASATENQQLGYNPAKTAFTNNYHQASISYLPWMTGVSSDTRFLNANYLANISSSSAMGLSLYYLRMGDLVIRDANGAILSDYQGSEYHLDGAYALQLGANASLGACFRVLGQNLYGTIAKNNLSVAGDLSYYQFLELGDISQRLEWGIVVSNLGPKVNNNPLPLQAGFGIGYSNTDATTNDRYVFSVDFRRLVNEDWKALRINVGGEYGYDSRFFLRGGVSLENPNKGDRKFFSLGIGYKGLVADQSWGFDLYYLVPFGVSTIVSPFQNAYGFTLSLSFGNFQ